MQNIVDQIREHRLIAIVRGITPNAVPLLADALLAGGIRCMEITFDHSTPEGTERTLESIRMLAGRNDGLLVGAGTVLSEREVELAAEAGARYMISPNANENVIRCTKRLGLCSIPGAFTATEVQAAYDWGADFVKLFPVSSVGPSYIKALRGPLPHIPMLAVGGVNPENIRSFLDAGAVGAGVGGNLVSPKLVAEGRLQEITDIARAYLDAIKQ